MALVTSGAGRRFGRIAFLVSDAAEAVTGQTLSVDGSLVMR